MGLLEKASLILTPNAINTGKLYSVIPANGSGDMTVVRATNATRINSAGLVEIPRTNLLQRSEEFNDVFWGKSNVTINPNATTAPNGTLTADKLVENTILTQHAITRTVTGISNQTSTLSIYLKRDGRDSATIYMFDNSYTNGFGTNVNLLTGTITLNYNQGTGVRLNSSITDAGNGWYKCTITGIVGGTSNNIAVYTAIGTTTSYAGDGTSGVFIWGAQLETGNVATEYIPTVASIRTSFAGITQDGASASNIARLNYETVGGCPAILIEPQRTNLLVNSVLSGTGTTPTSWVPGLQTGTSTPVQSIKNLSINAYRFITSTARQEFSQTFNLALNSISCFSVFVESVTTPIPVSQMIRVNPLAGGASTQVFLKNNIVITSLTNIEAGFTYTIQATCTISDSFQFRMGCGTDSLITGDVTLSMPQLETGVSPVNAYPTSYIPTFGSAQTRNADLISRSNIFTNNLITSAGGTWFIHLLNNISRTRDSYSQSIYIGQTSVGTGANGIQFVHGVTGRLVVEKLISGVSTTLYTTTTDIVKIAIKWNGTTADLFANGTKIVSATSYTVTNCQFLVANGIDVTKSINSTMLFPTPLTDTECINLTTL